ncbi:metallophosphoesterase family protein [Streptomyces cinereoruber]|uniref:metallophosphoesterase family protein n=1 Tax=Streptomyces cinereoruber TaxID=67260 RepID=UPI003C2B8A1A
MTAPERREDGAVVRVAAVGDIHLSPDCRGLLRPSFETLPLCADVLLLAGDLTRHGTVPEAEVVADEVRDLGVPVVAVLGNHDYHSDREADIARVLIDAGVSVLEGDRTVLPVDGGRLGIAGTKGFCGGFAGRSAGEFGEREMKDFVRTTRRAAEGLHEALSELADCEARIALTHFSPVPDTLAGEPVEIYPFLGSYLLAEAIDGAGADLAVHGHAHLGTEHGMTAGGVRVRNVAQPVIGKAFALYHLPLTRTPEHSGAGEAPGRAGRPPAADAPM